MPEWKLILRTGFGNVHWYGRWDHSGAVLIANAINSSTDPKKRDWTPVETYVRSLDWDPSSAE